MLKSFSSAPQITDEQLNKKRQQLRSTLQNDVVRVCGFLTSDLQVLAHFSPLKELALHLEPFATKSWSLVHRFPMQWPRLVLSIKTHTLNLLITAALLWIQSMCLQKSLHPISLLYFKYRDNWLNLKREVHQALYSFSFIWSCDNGKSEITRTLCELLVELSYQLGCIIIQCVRHVLHD